MIEENFVRMYSRDFAQLAVRAGLGQDVDVPLRRRLADARSHAQVMDQRKGKGHLPALASRIREEAERFDPRSARHGDDLEQAAADRLKFLTEIADTLSEPADG